MEGLLSLLVFAVLFYVMMRFGCGAHMMHGHKGAQGHGGESDVPKMHVDPVCSKEVAVDQGYGKMYQGELYRFCSRDCLDRFESDPEQFVSVNQAIKSKHHVDNMK